MFIQMKANINYLTYVKQQQKHSKLVLTAKTKETGN